MRPGLFLLPLAFLLASALAISPSEAVDFQKQRILNITAPSTSALYQNYTVNITLDTSSGFTGLQCSDGLIVTYNGEEIESHVSGCGTSNTILNFTLQKNLPKGQSTQNYSLYYSNATIVGPRNYRSGLCNQAYYFCDDFLGSSVDTNLWQVISGTWSVSGGQVASSTGGNFMRTKINFTTPVQMITEAQTNNTGSGQRYVGMLWANDGQRDATETSVEFGVCNACTNTHRILNWTSGSLTILSTTTAYTIDTNFHQYEMILRNVSGGDAVFKRDGATMITASPNAKGRSGFIKIGSNTFSMAWKHVIGLVTTDDGSTPTVTLGSEQNGNGTMSNQLDFSNPSLNTNSVTYYQSSFFQVNVTVVNGTTNSTVGSVYVDWGGVNRSMYLLSPISNSSGGGVFSFNSTWEANFTPGSYTIKFYATETVQEPDLNVTSPSADRTFTVNKATNNTVQISVSPGSTVTEGTTITVTGSETAGTGLTLTRDGVTVTNPFQGALSIGTYNFTVSSTETAIYAAKSATAIVTVGSGGFACTTPLTFAFTANVSRNGTYTAVDFTQFIAQNLVKPDLSDVYLNTTNATGARNVTGSSTYFVVDTTNVTEFRLDFGNYIGNQSWPTTNQNSNVTSMTLTEVRPYQKFSVFDEKTGVQQLPPGANRTMTVFCSQGTSSFLVNDTVGTVAFIEQPSNVRIQVQYSATEIYSRSLIPNASVEAKTWYLVDANLDQVAQMIMTLDDRTVGADFSDSAILRVTKLLGGGAQVITEVRFDVEQKAIIYLINGDEYTLQVDNGQKTRSIGNLLVETSDLEKTLIITDFSAFDPQQGNISWSVNMTDSGLIVFTWFDPAGLTQRVNFTVWNHTSGSVLFDDSSTSSDVTFTYMTPTPNATYRYRWHVQHPIFGQNSAGQTGVISGELTNFIPVLPDIVPASYLAGGVLVFLIFLAGIFGAKHSGVGLIIVGVFAATFAAWGWISFAGVNFGEGGNLTVPAIITGIIAIGFIGAFVHKRRSSAE